MDDYLAEIRLFAGFWEPRNWMFCDGRLLPVNDNVALFSLLGATYGGDGRINFALPDLRGRAPLAAGQGKGLSYRAAGSLGGIESVTLTVTQLPAHNHALTASSSAANAASPQGNYLAAGANRFTGTPQVHKTLASDALAEVGGQEAHNNMQPFVALHYIICVQGLYPSRS